MTTGYPASVDAINLSDWEFWRRPLAEREAAFALLRTHKPVAFYEEGETSFNIPGPGYWAVTRHADVVYASLHPEIFSSESGITTNDLPPGSGDVFGSMIVLDDPRHKRLRGLVSQAFSPHQLRKVNEHVESCLEQG